MENFEGADAAKQNDKRAELETAFDRRYMKIDEEYNDAFEQADAEYEEEVAKLRNEYKIEKEGPLPEEYLQRIHEADDKRTARKEEISARYHERIKEDADEYDRQKAALEKESEAEEPVAIDEEPEKKERLMDIVRERIFGKKKAE